MSVFISYNHEDKLFVNKLSLALISNNIKVWKDEWQISVGDSFIDKIQDGLEKASYICVVFSSNSIKSEWVKRELNAGLLREIEDKNLSILPVVIDNCKIPLLLRDKIYADFRGDFDIGLKKLLSALNKKYNIDNSGRVSKEDSYYLDYQIESGTINGKFFMRIEVISHDEEESFSILTKIDCFGNDFVTKEYLNISASETIKNYILQACSIEFSENPARVKLTGSSPSRGMFTIFDSKKKAEIKIKIVVSKLGIYNGNTVLFNVGSLFTQILESKGLRKKST